MNMSQKLAERAWEVIPGGVNTCRRKIDPPLAVARAKGAYFWDLDGRQYLDYHAAYGAIFLGHGHEAVVQAVIDEIHDRTLFGVGATETETRLAEKLVDALPSVEQVLICNSGSEATYHAIRLARAVTEREKIIKFQGCYHGFHDYALSATGEGMHPLTGREEANSLLARTDSAGMLRAAVENTHICRYNDLEDVRSTLDDISDEVAAIIVEPIAHNAPSILPEPGFLEGLRTLCDHFGILLIFDEVITGFRHALGGYQSLCGVMPDLTTVGKALGNGFPTAAIGGRREHMERFNTTPSGTVWFGGTYNGNAVAAAAGVAVVENLQDPSIYDHVFALGDQMRAGLTEIADKHGLPTAVSGYGSIYVLNFMEKAPRYFEDVLRNDASRQVRYRQELIKRGIFEMPESSGRNHISVMHTADDVAHTLEVAEDALLTVFADS
jgi:glutamate-1-semialdehyde 2,1-aminomutase